MRTSFDPYRLMVRFLILAMLLGLLLLALLKLLGLLLLAFGAVVAATLIRALADAIDARAHLGDRPAFYAALLSIVAVVTGVVWLFGSRFSADVSQLTDTLGSAWDSLAARIAQLPGGQGMVEALQDISLSGKDILPRLSSALGVLTTGITDVVLLLFGAVFIASDPGLYRRGLVMLVPKGRRDLAGDALDTAGAALRQWMVGQFFTMAFIGLLTGLGLWLVGVPAAAALGLMAAFLEAIPYLGPILSALPVLAMAATVDERTMFLALAVVVVVQQVEGSLVTPYVHKKVVSLPPAVSVFGVVAGGVLFGPLGLILAAPLLIVAFVLVKRLYVEEVLDTPVELPGRE